MMEMKLMLVDDHILFMESLQYLLNTYGIEVIGKARNGREAINKVRILNPDIILMDIRMPEMSGLEALRVIKTEKPNTKIVMLTTSEEEEDLLFAMKYGASGYLLKNTDGRELVRILQEISCNELTVSSRMASKLMDEFKQRYHQKKEGSKSESMCDDGGDLTERQYEILKLVAEGKTYKEVAIMVGLTERTVKYHMGNIIEKLHMENRAQVIAYASRNNYLKSR